MKEEVMKIIIGIDDSPHSKAALEFVKKARWPADTQFTVVSAVPIAVSAYSLVEAGAYAVSREIQEDQNRVHQELVARGEQELRTAGLTTQAKVELGDPREIILRVAEEQHADLVVVGSHGRSGFSKLLMGSVASHVVTHAPCSVLVVKLGPEAAKAI
jgi:nucleotide-binding universal stress UspA family protein